MSTVFKDHSCPDGTSCKCADSLPPSLNAVPGRLLSRPAQTAAATAAAAEELEFCSLVVVGTVAKALGVGGGRGQGGGDTWD